MNNLETKNHSKETLAQQLPIDTQFNANDQPVRRGKDETMEGVDEMFDVTPLDGPQEAGGADANNAAYADFNPVMRQYVRAQLRRSEVF